MQKISVLFQKQDLINQILLTILKINNIPTFSVINKLPGVLPFSHNYRNPGNIGIHNRPREAFGVIMSREQHNIVLTQSIIDICRIERPFVFSKCVLTDICIEVFCILSIYRTVKSKREPALHPVFLYKVRKSKNPVKPFHFVDTRHKYEPKPLSIKPLRLKFKEPEIRENIHILKIVTLLQF